VVAGLVGEGGEARLGRKGGIRFREDSTVPKVTTEKRTHGRGGG